MASEEQWVSRPAGQLVGYGSYLDITMHWQDEADQHIRAAYVHSGKSRDCFVWQDPAQGYAFKLATASSAARTSQREVESASSLEGVVPTVFGAFFVDIRDLEGSDRLIHRHQHCLVTEAMDRTVQEQLAAWKRVVLTPHLAQQAIALVCGIIRCMIYASQSRGLSLRERHVEKLGIRGEWLFLLDWKDTSRQGHQRACGGIRMAMKFFLEWLPGIRNVKGVLRKKTPLFSWLLFFAMMQDIIKKEWKKWRRRDRLPDEVEVNALGPLLWDRLGEVPGTPVCPPPGPPRATLRLLPPPRSTPVLSDPVRSTSSPSPEQACFDEEVPFPSPAPSCSTVVASPVPPWKEQRGTVDAQAASGKRRGSLGASAARGKKRRTSCASSWPLDEVGPARAPPPPWRETQPRGKVDAEGADGKTGWPSGASGVDAAKRWPSGAAVAQVSAALPEWRTSSASRVCSEKRWGSGAFSPAGGGGGPAERDAKELEASAIQRAAELKKDLLKACAARAAAEAGIKKEMHHMGTTWLSGASTLPAPWQAPPPRMPGLIWPVSYPPYVKEQLLREEKDDEARRAGALQGPRYVSLAKRHATNVWHRGRAPRLTRAELDNVGLLFRWFIYILPLDRIQGPLPRTAWQDGHRLVQQYGVRFGEHLKRECEGRGPDRATMSDLQKGMWSFWFSRLSNSHLRNRLWPDQWNTRDWYRLNNMQWRGFYISHPELAVAIRESVMRYFLARDVGLVVD